MAPDSSPSGQAVESHHGVDIAGALYTAEATVTGGRANGHGRTNDGGLDVQLRSPKELKGRIKTRDGSGHNVTPVRLT